MGAAAFLKPLIIFGQSLKEIRHHLSGFFFRPMPYADEKAVLLGVFRNADKLLHIPFFRPVLPGKLRPVELVAGIEVQGMHDLVDSILITGKKDGRLRIGHPVGVNFRQDAAGKIFLPGFDFLLRDGDPLLKDFCRKYILGDSRPALSDMAKVAVPGEKPCEKYVVDSLEFETVPAYNVGKPFHPKSAGWVGYVLNVDGSRVYVAGDTDATAEAENVKCDVALLPIGGTYTMNAKQAAGLANKIRPAAVIPVHYGGIVGRENDGFDFEKQVDGGIKVAFKIRF